MMNALDGLNANRLLTTQEVAQIMRVSVATVLRWAELGANGPLPSAFRTSPRGNWRFPPKDIRALVGATNSPSREAGNATASQPTG